MRTFFWILLGLLLLAGGMTGGAYITGGLPALERIAVGDLPALGAAPAAEAATTPPPAPSSAATVGGADDHGKILFYRDPMGLPDISQEPKKDSMGMDYIPVYENEAQDDGNVVKISLDKVQKLGVKTEAAAVRTLTRTIQATGTVHPDESRQVVVTSRFDARRSL